MKSVTEQRQERVTQCGWTDEWHICYLMILVDGLFPRRSGRWCVMVGLN